MNPMKVLKNRYAQLFFLLFRLSLSFQFYLHLFLPEFHLYLAEYHLIVVLLYPQISCILVGHSFMYLNNDISFYIPQSFVFDRGPSSNYAIASIEQKVPRRGCPTNYKLHVRAPSEFVTPQEAESRLDQRLYTPPLSTSPFTLIFPSSRPQRAPQARVMYLLLLMWCRKNPGRI